MQGSSEGEGKLVKESCLIDISRDQEMRPEREIRDATGTGGTSSTDGEAIRSLRQLPDWIRPSYSR